MAVPVAAVHAVSSAYWALRPDVALNYVMWLELARRTAKDARRRSQRSALVTLNDAQMNQHLLNHGWSVLLGE